MITSWPDCVLVRHGEPADTARGTFLGRTDPPLDPTGREGIRATARMLKGLLPSTPRRVWCSGLTRARESAAILADDLALGDEIRSDPRLDEADFGAWDGLTPAQIDERWPGEARAWLDDPVNRHGPGGENLRHVDRRVGDWLDGLRAGEDVPVMVVAHFGSLCVLAARLLELPVDRAVRLALNRAQAGWISGGRIRFWGIDGQMFGRP